MRRWLTGAVLLGALALFVSVFSFGIWSTIGPTYEEARAIVAKILQTGHPIQTIQQAIASEDIPASMQIRLMLWLNAIEVLSRNVLFGSGIAWKDYWLQAHYSDTGFDLLHNGYLEIAVRYGLLGLAFYTILYAWTARTAYKAFQRGLIPIEAFNAHIVLLVFFLVTIARNSNNRLAIGESYMMLAGAFGFFCHYLCQRAAVPAGKLEPA
jgi:O-antigen ligase